MLKLVAVVLLCLGGLALQQAAAGSGIQDHDSGSVAGHAVSDGSHLPVLLEGADAVEAISVDSEHLNALLLGLFMVSLGLLLGAGLIGGTSERRLLELLRLPSVLPLTPARAPLATLEVFRL